jgi:hypothetical protein
MRTCDSSSVNIQLGGSVQDSGSNKAFMLSVEETAGAIEW